MSDRRRKKMTPRFAKRAARMNALCTRLGLQPLDDDRIQASFEARERRCAEVRKQNDPYTGCKSVTAFATALGMRRADLFGWLEHEGWLHRDEDGWRGTREAAEAGWVVMRGPESIAWPQIAPNGQRELANLLDVHPDADSATRADTRRP